MMARNDLDQTENLTIELKAGMAWALYSDDGPGGPCGQSMRTTCSHSVLHIWQAESAMREALASGIGRNKKSRIMCGVVGDWTSGGVFGVVFHGRSNLDRSSEQE
jgi:hypothetical protein